MFASGAIHALALLASDVPKRGLPVTEKEVDYWSETFFGWFNSVKQHFPEPLRAEFQEKAEAILRSFAKGEHLFRDTWEQLKDTIERLFDLRTVTRSIVPLRRRKQSTQSSSGCPR